MSGPLVLTAEDCKNLGWALQGLGRLTRETGVDFSGYGDFTVTLGANSVRVALRDGEYIVDDRNGS